MLARRARALVRTPLALVPRAPLARRPRARAPAPPPPPRRAPLTYYSAWFCPFAHRATIALEHHGIAYEWRGTFFSGEGLGIVDCVLLPYAFRLYVLEHYRGFAVPRDRPWSDAYFGVATPRRAGLPNVAKTLPDKAKYLKHVAKYAHGAARSKIARRNARVYEPFANSTQMNGNMDDVTSPGCGTAGAFACEDCAAALRRQRVTFVATEFNTFHAVSPASMCPACFAYAVTFRGPLARILSGVDAYGAPPAAVGEAALAAAASAVANFDVVLILEHLGDHLAQLTCVLGWADVAEVALNGNGRASFRDVAGLDATFHDRLAAANRLDGALFARAVARAASRRAPRGAFLEPPSSTRRSPASGRGRRDDRGRARDGPEAPPLLGEEGALVGGDALRPHARVGVEPLAGVVRHETPVRIPDGARQHERGHRAS
ncbi:glutathione transferase [Aureococcus anophagefferens]|uniref:Glutathione transferase n=1 Tax=Aureococcus anophagefferens TaxID=44056 RepID=A0ABR1FWA3_AURAN